MSPSSQTRRVSGASAQARARVSRVAGVLPPQDTITGFLLAGVGNVDLRRKSNFLIVDQSAPARAAAAASPLGRSVVLAARRAYSLPFRPARRDVSARN